MIKVSGATTRQASRWVEEGGVFIEVTDKGANV